ncbi:anthranilate phosphoribosyltransferase [Rhizomicrobium palustre]|uniref:Anthranilate phosphoribosyltransferase n=1 Tax=Rhizomicrobium palustre TaxID=189966 RepID=A0A846N0X8_9PROT|nr:anthranilate phosphoribosyltransferase [Rhizomicrobium palustre]NIK89614.1 anthranilate phosphoribosyltransferase [Rhizomicrobium palustre]
MTSFGTILKRVAAGEILDAETAAEAFHAILKGEAGDVQMGAFLAAIAVRKPAVDEVVGAVTAMRAAMTRVKAPADAMDLVGTGGDGLSTLNISSAASFVVAAAGVNVAKHGNRNMTSRSGAADVLEALGVKVEVTPEAATICIEETGLCFLFAQGFHPAMRYVTPVRRALGFRTIFNLIGPLSNPAGAKRQLLGVYARDLLEPVAKVLAAHGAEKAFVVHGAEGLDEISISGETYVTALENGETRSFVIVPEDAGLPRWPIEAVKGGDAPENAAALTRLLNGEKGAYRDIVLLNSAAALMVADKAGDLREGVDIAAKMIDSGAAKAVLQKLITVSNGCP